MTKPRFFAAPLILLAMSCPSTTAQQSGSQPPKAPAANQEKPAAPPGPMSCPLHEKHMKEMRQGQAGAAGQHDHSLEAMNARGEEERGMGFSQSATTHHFLLAKDGGAIQVEANDPADTQTREAIRKHLQRIAASFASGDFSIPNFVHGEDPAGVAEMKKLGAQIRYTFEETQLGGRVVVVSEAGEALRAVHVFLRYQITEHRTGDPLEVPR